jgi:hypothetical protein
MLAHCCMSGSRDTAFVCVRLLNTSHCQSYDILRWAHECSTTPMTDCANVLQSVGKSEMHYRSPPLPFQTLPYIQVLSSTLAQFLPAPLLHLALKRISYAKCWAGSRRNMKSEAPCMRAV